MWNQYERIRRYGNQSRTSKAYNIAKRYGTNIQGSSAWTSSFREGMKRFDRANSSNRHLRSYDGERKTAGYGAADRVKVSRAVYMGNANG